MKGSSTLFIRIPYGFYSTQLRGCMDSIDIARFWSKVEVGNIHECWPWRGCKDDYGKFKVDGELHVAHRVALWLVFGTPLDGIVVRHRCDNPPCCNPYHLLTGSHADNVADRVLRDRSARGIRNGRSKLTDEQVRAIRADPRPNVAICQEYGVCNATVSNIKNRRTWTHVK